MGATGAMIGNWRSLATVIELFDSQRVPLNSRDRHARQGRVSVLRERSGIIDHIDGYISTGR